MQKPFLLSVMFALSAYLMLTPSEAQAGLITYGETISEVGELTPEKIKELRLNNKFKVGYKYSYFGLFFLDLWTGDGEFCLYKDAILDEAPYEPIDKQRAAELMGIAEDQIQLPFLYRYPLLLLIIGFLIVANAVLFAIRMFMDLRNVPPPKPLTPPNDPPSE